ncbi:ArnT family glycosyltransferase [Croceicoccus marinus]|uniref:Glycosyltransferase RgtA/B/C/D-like domain-containing protein n=1 Tax=Croceicoccus marinus TaxID=450378 RepID=A0A1Z1FCI5_9SPHN|nr:hypothetical protein [Croceicoccus marinus]ARU16387.1 hypothetical protein A9D14_09540 [Croceicoccus marinus]
MRRDVKLTEREALWPLAVIALLLVLQFSMIFTRSINWDEFYWNYEIEAFVKGGVSRPLQTLHARLFSWLPGRPGNAVDHIVVARCFMFACEIATLCFIAGIARRFTGRANAYLCALAYLSAGYVFQHGFSLRSDPMVTAVLTGALYVLARLRVTPVSVLCFGLLAGSAPLITIKCVLYLPAFAALFWLRLSESGRSIAARGRLALYPVAAVFGFAVIYLMHSATMPAATLIASSGGDAATSAAKASGAMIGASIRAMFFIGTPPYLPITIKSASISPAFAALLLLSPFAIWRITLTRPEKLALSGLLSVILTLFFYRNSAAYYYVFVLAPAAAALGPSLSLARKRLPVWALSAIFLVFALLVFAKEDRTVIARQRQTLGAVHQIFPDPVAYIDHNGMIGDFHKMNLLMTPWGMEQYRASKENSYRSAMQSRPVPLLLENDTLLTEVMTGDRPASILSAADVAALRGNYVRYWGPVWITGKRIPGSAKSVRTEFLVPGDYRVVGSPLRIDGAVYGPGAIVSIDRGMHELLAKGDRDTLLLWADAAEPPSTHPPQGYLFVGF